VVETAAAVWTDRHIPPAAIIDQCRGLSDSGVVDGVLIPDQLANFIPAQLWNSDNTPLAAVMPDPDSQCDTFAVAAYVAGLVPELALHLTTDSVRRPPAELIQTMLTLAHLTGGRATLQVGGGEVKQTGPFGHPTNQGMSRMGDLFQIYRKVMDSDRPFDHDGRRWKFQGAFLGSKHDPAPEIWGLGSGPQLLEHVAKYADGLGTCIKFLFHNPEQTAEGVSRLRRRVAELGRDPAAFRVGLWASVLPVDDDEQLSTAADNKIIKFITGALGRIETWRWREEGAHLALPLPQHWTYYKYLLPYAMTDQDVADIVDNVTPEHVEHAWFVGTPADVAAQIKPYLTDEINLVAPFDYIPIMNGDAEGGVRRMVELCGLLRKM